MIDIKNNRRHGAAVEVQTTAEYIADTIKVVKTTLNISDYDSSTS
ncbi:MULTISPECIES: hypothetical protein [Photobacterium]|uniref:Uncharacterized protein n=1 Tax=Photobacterium piscicola TaxID=1378299 RepID=A0A1T5I3P5_9GAMM|nr:MULTISPECIES: hypothetical protein [Photobacterium]SKC33671.1 hypothetical protein CZ809_03269 [Photobacterium piscicola]